jgi:general secretion pathway protein M
MRAWYAELSRREQLVVVTGAVIAALIIVWALLWRPLTLGVESTRTALAAQQALLLDLRRAESLTGAAAAAPSGAAELQSLVVLVDRTHREHGLTGALSRNQPDGPDGIRVTLQDAAFDSLMAWLTALQQNYRVTVESASINGSRTPGLVSATLVLRRA